MNVISQIRNNSHYPAFRGVLSVGAGVCYVVVAFLVIAGFFGFFTGEFIGAIGLFVAAGLLFALTKVGIEVSSMIADIADCAVMQHEKNSQAS